MLVVGSLNERTPSIRSGLVKSFLFDNSYLGRQNRNLLDTNQWKLGTNGTQGNFSLNGNASVDINTIIMYENPWGFKEPTWASLSNDPASDGDGGWNVYNKTIDPTKKYRLSVWVKRENVGNGTIYFGCQGNVVSNLGSTTANANPYFTNFGPGFTAANENYVLMVGYIYPHNYTGSADLTSGVYNTSGTRLAGMNEFKWMPNATVGGHRTYLFYSTSTTERVYWVRPRMEVCDGTESTIEDLLLGIDDNAYIGSQSNTTLLLNGSGVAIEEGTTNLVTNSDLIDSNSDGLADAFSVSAGGNGDSARIFKNSVKPGINTNGNIQRVEVVATGTTDSSYIVQVIDGIVAGNTYTFSSYVRVGIASSGCLQIRWRDASGNTIGTDISSKYVTNANEFERLTLTAVAPANATRVNFFIRGFGNAIGTWLEMEGVQLEQKIFASSYVSGKRSAEASMTVPLDLGSEFTIAIKIKPQASWGRLLTTSIGKRIFNVRDKNSQLSFSFEDYKTNTALGTSSQPWIGFDSFVTSAQASWWHWHVAGVDFLAGYDCWVVITKNGPTWKTYHFSNSKPLVSTINTSINASLVNFSPDLIIFNPAFSAVYSNLSVYNKALTDREIDSLVNNKFNIRADGSIYALKLDEKPYFPNGSIYFPLKDDALSIDKNISASEFNLESIDGNGAWVGTPAVNVVNNPTTGSIPGYSPGWDASLHPSAISVYGWSQGYNGGVPSPTIGYHGQWVYEGINNDPCMKFIDQNESYGNPHRWLGINRSIGTPNALGWSVGTVVTISWYQKTNVLGKGAQVGLYHKQVNSGAYGFEAAIGYYSVNKIDTWERVFFTYTITSNWDLTSDVSIYIYGHAGAVGILWADSVQVEAKPYISPFVNGTRSATSLEFNLYRDYGLKWNNDWSIVYWKKPMGTHTDSLAGYNIESIGCNSNTVGGNYLFWGKDINANAINSSTPSTIDPNVYFNNFHMISLVKNGSELTIKQRVGANVHVRTVNVASIKTENAYLTQYGYDLKLGGWDNGNSCGTFYKDLIVAQKAFTEDELNNTYKNVVKQNKNKLIIQGNFKENIAFKL